MYFEFLCSKSQSLYVSFLWAGMGERSVAHLQWFNRLMIYIAFSMVKIIYWPISFPSKYLVITTLHQVYAKMFYEKCSGLSLYRGGDLFTISFSIKLSTKQTNSHPPRLESKPQSLVQQADLLHLARTIGVTQHF